MLLRSAGAHYLRQQRFLALALAAVRRAFNMGEPRRAVPMLAVLQHEAAVDAARSIPEILAEQGIQARQVGTPNTLAIAGSSSDGRPLLRLIVDDAELYRLERVAVTQVADAARMGASLAITATPGVGYVRMVNPPCCSRCAILAGKFFRFNAGFERHPQCDCRHIPTTEDAAGDVTTNPDLLLRLGEITDLTNAEKHALNAGADLARVVNARRDLWLDSPSHPSLRRIYQQAGDDQDLAIRLLKQAGYLI